MKQHFLAVLSMLLFSSTVFSEVETYDIADTHSFANFSIRHVVSKTSGTFSDIKGVIKIDRDDLAKSSVSAKIRVSSINTSHAKRDDHIQKADYLDMLNFGDMTFVSTKVQAQSVTEGIMTGTFTLHGVSKEITFPFKVLGFGKDPWGGNRVGFEAHLTIKASDYGFSWMKKPKPSVGDNIEVTLLIEGIKAKKYGEGLK